MPNARRLAIVASLLLAAVARAELPPYVYEEMQAAAGEALRVRVVDVKVTDTVVQTNDPGGGRPVDVVAAVDVLAVTRSATGLKPGDRVVVKYLTIADRTRPISGPSLIPVLKAGQETAAWLTRDGDAYAAAAGGATFREGNRPTTTTAPAAR